MSLAHCNPSCVLPSIVTGLAAALDLVKYTRKTALPADERGWNHHDHFAFKRLVNLETALGDALAGRTEHAVEAVSHVLAAHSGLSEIETEQDEPREVLCRQRDAFVAVRVVLSMVGFFDS